jgi:hypothetical protein
MRQRNSRNGLDAPVDDESLQVFASSGTACWIFDMADRWKPSSGVSSDKVLVTAVFDDKGEALTRDQPSPL